MADQLKWYEKYLTLFKTSQCSWCRKFYTNQPFLCPPKKLQSNCTYFDGLFEIPGWYSREEEIKKYEQRIVEMMQEVERDGIMAKCRDSKCGALNPNPQHSTCWKCEKDTLHCPEHKSLILRYNIEENYWRCPEASHAQKFYVTIESAPTDTLCPECSKTEEKTILYYDAESFLLKCKRCNKFFVYDKGKLREVRLKKKK